MARDDAIVIGSGPNGLAAAIVLARAGVQVRVLEAGPSVGGAVASAATTVDGLVHDLGSAVHPLAAASPALSSWPLERFGLLWVHPPVAVAHPLPDREAARLVGTVVDTANDLGPSGETWSRWLSPIVRRWTSVAPAIMRPLLRTPPSVASAAALASFGVRALVPWGTVARSFRDPRAAALWAGIAAHAVVAPSALGGSAPGWVLAAAGHTVGWPFPRGGAQALARAMASYLRSLGGTIETNARVDSLSELIGAHAIVATVGSRELVRIGASSLPMRYAAAVSSMPPGPSIVKLDLAVEGGIPWRDDSVSRAGTVHLGGHAAQVMDAVRAVAHGELPVRPYVLLAQPGRFDASRCAGGVEPVWAYAHVPRALAYDDRATSLVASRIVDTIEASAPGVRDVVRATRRWLPADLERWNANVPAGDPTGGATTLWRMVARPVPSGDPYATGRAGVYVGGSSTPPGPGVHGMCGVNAAISALVRSFGMTPDAARDRAFACEPDPDA